MKQRLADMWNLIYSFRNDILWLILFIVSVIFRLKNYVDGQAWADLVKNTFLGVAAVRGTEHLVSVVTSYVNAVKGNAQTAEPLANPQISSDNLVNGDGQ